MYVQGTGNLLDLDQETKPKITTLEEIMGSQQIKSEPYSDLLSNM